MKIILTKAEAGKLNQSDRAPMINQLLIAISEVATLIAENPDQDRFVVSNNITIEIREK